jgi:hypothetical protein
MTAHHLKIAHSKVRSIPRALDRHAPTCRDSDCAGLLDGPLLPVGGTRSKLPLDGDWCNGSTTDSDSVSPSSNLGSPVRSTPVASAAGVVVGGWLRPISDDAVVALQTSRRLEPAAQATSHPRNVIRSTPRLSIAGVPDAGRNRHRRSPLGSGKGASPISRRSRRIR